MYTGSNSPIDLVGGEICSDLKRPMTPRDRLNNEYMINFADHYTSYCRVFLVPTKDAAAKQFEHFLESFEKQFNCRIHVLRTDSGGEYQNVDLFCKKTGVARQRSEARHQSSNGKAERMPRTIMNMARCMIFACGLPLNFWGDAVQNPVKQNFTQRAQRGMIVGIGEETKGYRVYLPQDKVVVTTQHVRNIETLERAQNENAQKSYLQNDEAEAEEQSAGDAAVAANSSKKKSRKKKKKGYTRETHVTRSIARQAEEKSAEAIQQEESSKSVVASFAASVMSATPPPRVPGQAARKWPT
ncbi:hypothetical protein PR003_g21832 [Phytophthora rubi]|uniref:Integrase catalytic domain-containing protein n=1 Tax=Phytophthora rubi TaxID=129364 RepID=A0A6A4DDG6_9STRA|nr:hypothetical protein PR003_g21832 [Phytophthora rubi]